MEALFEVRTCIERKTYQEIYWPMVFGNRKAKTGFLVRVFLMAILSAVMVYLALTPTLRGGMNAAIYILLGLFWAGFALSAQTYAFKSVRRNKKNYQSAVLDVIIDFYDDRFEQDSITSGTQYTVRLNEIVKVHDTKHYYFLVVSDGYHCIAKDGFRKGCADEFVAYLRERGVAVD